MAFLFGADPPFSPTDMFYTPEPRPQANAQPSIESFSEIVRIRFWHEHPLYAICNLEKRKGSGRHRTLGPRLLILTSQRRSSFTMSFVIHAVFLVCSCFTKTTRCVFVWLFFLVLLLFLSLSLCSLCLSFSLSLLFFSLSLSLFLYSLLYVSSSFPRAVFSLFIY